MVPAPGEHTGTSADADAALRAGQSTAEYVRRATGAHSPVPRRAGSDAHEREHEHPLVRWERAGTGAVSWTGTDMRSRRRTTTSVPPKRGILVPSSPKAPAARRQALDDAEVKVAEYEPVLAALEAAGVIVVEVHPAYMDLLIREVAGV